jgi:hypothetical protein
MDVSGPDLLTDSNTLQRNNNDAAMKLLFLEHNFTSQSLIRLTPLSAPPDVWQS